MQFTTGSDVFEVETEPVDVTSLSRPDVGWTFIDAHGHQHQWCVDGLPAMSYQPSKRYDVPTAIWVVDYVAYFPDGEPYNVGHHECRICGDRVEPRLTADTHRQFIPGLRTYRINGETVSEEEFLRRAKP